MSFGWANLASNQMVSFTDAQGSGFSLKASQSHVTSEQCMTKAEVLAKYDVHANSFDNYTDSQLVPKGAWQSVVVYQSAAYSESATKNSCAVGGTGSSVTLYAYVGQFTSTVDQATANAAAVTWVQANKQSYANTNGTCTWLSVVKSGTFTRTNCDAGYAGGSSTYTVAAGAYSSTISQVDADAKAQFDVDTNGQNRINGGSGGLGTATAGTCTISLWYNIEKSGSFTRTNCGTAYTGGSATYTVAAGVLTSTVSQADADAKAQSDVDTYGQNAVNGIPGGSGTATAGTCTLRTTAWRGLGIMGCEIIPAAVPPPPPAPVDPGTPAPVLPENNNSIYLISIEKVSATNGVRIIVGSTINVASRIRVDILLHGINGGDKLTGIYLAVGTNYISGVGNMGTATINSGVTGEIVSLSPASDATYSYSFTPGVIV